MSKKENEITKEWNVKNFFSYWFYVSIILLLIGLIISTVDKSEFPEVTYLLTLSANLFQSVGLAIFIANIFTFIIGTNQFLSFIRDRLVQIVVSKNFISTLNQEEQYKLLHLTLKPTNDLSNLYSGINDYFNNYIKESMKLFDNSYRGKLQLDATASFNREKNCIQIESEMDYIVYKVSDEFDPIPLMFEDEKSEHLFTSIKAPGKDIHRVSDDNCKDMESISDPSLTKGVNIEVPEEFNSEKHIHVTRKFVEYGNDHWQAYSYKSVRPYDGLIIKLKCEDNISIRAFNTYGKEEDFTVEKENKYIKIQYHDWLTPGFGVNIIVSINDHHTCSDCKTLQQ